MKFLASCDPKANANLITSFVADGSDRSFQRETYAPGELDGPAAVVGLAGEARPLRAAGVTVVARRPDLLLKHMPTRRKERRDKGEKEKMRR